MCRLDLRGLNSQHTFLLNFQLQQNTSRVHFKEILEKMIVLNCETFNFNVRYHKTYLKKRNKL